MRLTILADNNSIIDRYFLAEPALSFFIEDGHSRILFDTGYSDVFLKNARKMKLNLRSLDYIVLSHEHLDHTLGMRHLTGMLRPTKKPKLVCHPLLFRRTIPKKKMSRHFRIETSIEPAWITKKLVFLGQIPRKFDFEKTTAHFREDSSLACISSNGLVIMSGCAHSGICNTIEYAKKVCDDNRIAAIIGGFHLLKPPKQQMQGTVKYFKKLKNVRVYPCHCTDLQSKIALSKVAHIEEVGVGMKIQF